MFQTEMLLVRLLGHCGFRITARRQKALRPTNPFEASPEILRPKEGLRMTALQRCAILS